VRREPHGKQSVLKRLWLAVEVLALFAAQVERFVGSPGGAGASGKIEFDAVFEGASQTLSGKGFRRMGSPQGRSMRR
jgi:hypothetical protein